MAGSDENCDDDDVDVDVDDDGGRGGSLGDEYPMSAAVACSGDENADKDDGNDVSSSSSALQSIAMEAEF